MVPKAKLISNRVLIPWKIRTSVVQHVTYRGKQQLCVTDLHEEEAGTGGGVVVHVNRQEDSCCHDDHHHDDARQETDLQPLITLSCVCVLLVSCCTEAKTTRGESDSNILTAVLKVSCSDNVISVKNFYTDQCGGPDSLMIATTENTVK